MGGAVSSGRDNTELIDNLMGGNYIRTRDVERVFRALDRGDYMTPEARDQAYKDLAWRNGPLHMSAPCIYSEVMEGLELKPGLSFLNIGSGTGYLSTLVGLILGSSGINHGVEVHPVVVDYANKKLAQFLDVSPTLDEFDFCEPKFLCGNGLCLAPLQAPYDRVYCGAGCPEEYQNYFQQLIKVGGILIMPLNDNLLQVRRTGQDEWVTRSLLNVSFATLRVPTKEEKGELIRLEEQTPARLQVLARAVIRARMRGAMRRRHPHVREPPPRAPPAKRACPRRICIPVDDDSDTEGLNALHDLDRASGANEMNALLSLVLSMGHNRVAGALRVDPLDSDSSSSSYRPEDDEPADRASPTLRIVNVNDRPRSGDEANARPSVRSVLMFEFRDRNGVVRRAHPPARRHPRDPRHPPHPRHPRTHQRSDGSEDSDDDVDNDDDVPDDVDADGSVDADDDAARQNEQNGPVEHPKESQSASGDNPPAENNDKVIISVYEKIAAEGDGEALNKDTESKAKEVTSEEKDEPADERELKSEDNEIASEEKEATTGECSTSNGKASKSRWPSRRREQWPSRQSSSKPYGSRDKDKKAKSRRRSVTNSRRSSDDKKDDSNKNPEVPAEVEICLGKTSDVAGPSTMEWEASGPAETEGKGSSEDESTETTETSRKEDKRQKLDSGIGEENSPSGGSASHKSGDDDSQRSDTESDEGCEDDGRVRRAKRGHLSTRSSSSTSGSDDDQADELVRDDNGQYHSRKPRKPRKDHEGARRSALSVLMKRAVRELPLPHALQKYVNLGRCFEF